MEQEIQRWKDSLLNSGNFDYEHILELESHLLDEIDNLQGKGLQDEEILLLAQRRIGSHETLSQAYNPNGKFTFKKISWGLQGILFLFLFRELSLLFTYFSSDIILVSDFINTGLNFSLAIVFQLLAMLVLIAVFKRTLYLSSKYRSSLRPNIFIISSLVITFLLRLVYFKLVDNPAAMVEPVTVAQTLSFFPLVLVVLTMIVAIIREKRSKQFDGVLSK